MQRRQVHHFRRNVRIFLKILFVVGLCLLIAFASLLSARVSLANIDPHGHALSGAVPSGILTTNNVHHESAPAAHQSTIRVMTSPAEVNPHAFRYLLNNVDACAHRRHDLFLLTFVHSAPANYKRRTLIRETWGNQLRLYDDVKNVVLFAIGKPSNPPDENGTTTIASSADELQRAIELESDRYHDIIQEDFIDSYRNLTYKAILWLKWASNYCPNALYVLKVDDDILLDVFSLAKHLVQLYRRNITTERTILCLVWDAMPVLRDKLSKWYISPEEYTNDYFSRYCSGSAYILTADLVYPMYEASLQTRFFWVDDFYVTGLLPKVVQNVSYYNLASVYRLKSDEVQSGLVDSYSIFGHAPDAIGKHYSVWKLMLKTRNIKWR